MTEVGLVVGIGKLIINDFYSGYFERVYYAGMPSKDSFSLIYETAYVREKQGELITKPQDHMQLFFPVGYEETIKFPGRNRIEFKVVSVTPTSLTAIIVGE